MPEMPDWDVGDLDEVYDVLDWLYGVNSDPDVDLDGDEDEFAVAWDENAGWGEGEAEEGDGAGACSECGKYPCECDPDVAD